MNILLSFLFISISLLVQISNYEQSDSSFSLLLDKVRKDVIKSSLLNLSKNTNSYLMEMIKLIVKEKINNNLTDVEGAFLVYEWIAENIKIDCMHYYEEKESLDSFEYLEYIVHRGRGSVTRISTLFYMICSIMKIDSGYIDGYSKIYNTILNEYQYTEIQHMWNFILINDTKYLIDASLGIGYCEIIDTIINFKKAHTYLYFGTKPEILIKMNFPKNEEFQMLEKKFTKNEWNNWAFRTRFFYTYGLINLEPDKELFNPTKDKFTIKYDTSNSDIDVGGNFVYESINFYGVINGEFIEISFSEKKKYIFNYERVEIYVGTKEDPWQHLAFVLSSLPFPDY